jgi:hypothetical protein
MSDYVSLTTEEWSALIATLGLPEPVCVGLALPGGDSDQIDLGLRSLLGRGLLAPGAGDDDVDPLVSRLLVGMLEAEEVLSICVALAGSVTRRTWFANGDTGIATLIDELGNIRLEIAPLEAVCDVARSYLTSLRSSAPGSEQYALDLASLEVALRNVQHGEPAELGVTASRPMSVDMVGSVESWVADGDHLNGEVVVVVGLPRRGTWVVDGDGEVPLLTQLRQPWPDLVSRFAPV